MRNLRVTTLVAGALVAGLVLGGLGIASATTSGSMNQGKNQSHDRAVDPTSTVTPPSVDVVKPSVPSIIPTPTVPSVDTTRPPMPPNAQGHAYGRVISHPHTGLHRGQVMSANAGTHKAHKAQHVSHKSAMGVKNSTKHASKNTGGSMMGR